MTATARAIEVIADVASSITYDDLPPDITDAAAMLVCDSLTCAHGAVQVERGAVAARTWARAGGPEESRIAGDDRLVASRNAAAANADLGNVLDADDTFLNSAHFAVTNVATALAEGERVHASGRDVVVAVVAGFELSARLHLAFEPSKTPARPVGMTYPTLGATLSAALAAGSGRDVVAHALGLACWLTPTASAAHVGTRRTFSAFKYAPYGAMAGAAVDAARFADDGLPGDLDALDDGSFADGQGAAGLDRGRLLAGWGERWWISSTSIKPYPSFRLGHAHVDAVQRVVGAQRVDPDDVERVEVWLDPRAFALPFVREAGPLPDGPTSVFAGAMSLPHALSCCALGIPAGPRWYAPETFADQRRRAFARRVHVATEPATGIGTIVARRDPATGRFAGNLGRTRIVCGGDVFDDATEDCLGDPWNAATRWSWQRAEAKARSFAPADPDGAVQRVRGAQALGRADDVTRLPLV